MLKTIKWTFIHLHANDINVSSVKEIVTWGFFFVFDIIIFMQWVRIYMKTGTWSL